MNKLLWAYHNNIGRLGPAAVIIGCLFSMVYCLTSGNVFAFTADGCNADCNSCHTLSKAEAVEITKKIKIPDAKVLAVQISPIKGLWEVTIDSQGKGGLVYVDFSKKYIVQGPIVEVSTGVNKTQAQYQKIQESRKIDVSKISLKNALVLGDNTAKKRVIVFTDPDCPFCGKLHEEMKKVIERRKDIVFYVRLFPLKIHPDSYWKAKSIVCNKSMQMLEDNFAKKTIPRNECDTKEVDNTIKMAESLGISGTPTLILPNGKMRSGAMSAEQIVELIDGKK